MGVELMKSQETWLTNLKGYWNSISDFILGQCQSGEAVTLNLSGENTLYVRLNSSLIRQNTSVTQNTVELIFQRGKRRVAFQADLCLSAEVDQKLFIGLLSQARAECSAMPDDPFVTDFKNNGSSDQNFAGETPDLEEILRSLTDETKGSDFTGLLALGPVVRANRNSEGQRHWFASHQFFIDYSLFTVNEEGENKAVKSTYSGRKWSSEAFRRNFKDSFAQLQLLKRKNRVLNPGEYRAYLAPGAMGELIHMLSWNGMSLGAYKKGSCAFASLYEGKQKLSPFFSLRENFELGLAPSFNSLGEVAPMTLPLIEKGELKNFLVSTRTAKETGAESNFSDINSWGQEYLRSPEILPGELTQDKVLSALGTGVYLSQLHYCNWSHVLNARVTGMTRYACFWVEQGEIVAPIKDMRFDDSLYRIFGSSLEAMTKETSIEPVVDTYWLRGVGGKKTPGALLNQFSFKG